MVTYFNQYILNRFGPKAREFLTKTEFGKRILLKVFSVKGCHISLLGQPDSGKTRKMHWLASFLSKFETIVWIDSCKDEEIAPLFFMGKPVNIIIPIGTEIEVTPGRQYNVNLPKDERVKEENLIDPQPFEIKKAYLPFQFWDLVKPNEINIFSIRQYYFNEQERSRFHAKLFKVLAERSSEEWFRDVKGIKRMSVFIDEAQRIVPSTSYSHEPEALAVAQDVTANILEVRAYGVRLIMGTQDYMNIYPAARRNMPCRILCHGAVIKSDESKQMHRLGVYSESYAKWEGLVVFPDGSYFPTTCPWTFPDFPKPKGARIRYLKKVDRPLVSDEVEQEMPDLGRYAAMAIEPEETEPLKFSRWDDDGR